jgi:biopolymer transport protein ExbD
MFRRRDRTTADTAVDLTSMIDMTFILLIFFMVSTTFVKDMTLEIERPGAQSATPASTRAVRLYIDRAGDVYLDGQPVRVWTLQSRLAEQLRGTTQKSVLVVTDEHVPSGKLVEVVDQARRAGASDVGVATVDEAGAG